MTLIQALADQIDASVTVGSEAGYSLSITLPLRLSEMRNEAGNAAHSRRNRLINSTYAMTSPLDPGGYVAAQSGQRAVHRRHGLLNPFSRDRFGVSRACPARSASVWPSSTVQ